MGGDDAYTRDDKRDVHSVETLKNRCVYRPGSNGPALRLAAGLGRKLGPVDRDRGAGLTSRVAPDRELSATKFSGSARRRSPNG